VYFVIPGGGLWKSDGTDAGTEVLRSPEDANAGEGAGRLLDDRLAVGVDDHLVDLGDCEQRPDDVLVQRAVTQHAEILPRNPLAVVTHRYQRCCLHVLLRLGDR
jgi:ELWxxDGT repeat protein